MKLTTKIVALSSTVVMAFSMLSIGASAEYIQSDLYKTPGGDSGYVWIKSGTYKELYEPSGSVHVMYYGARAEILYSDSVKTQFIISGSFCKNSSNPTSFYKSSTSNSIEDLRTTKFDYCTGIVLTRSTAFGNTNKRLDHNF